VVEAVGKREAHKQATRRSLKAAADRLFSERGFTNTTVRDIAAAAGVTERTFFRYFTGKEELLVEDLTAWLPVLGRQIRERPAQESPLSAIENASFAVMARIATANLPGPGLLFHDGPPGPKLSRLAPGLAMLLEQTIAQALATRLPPAPTRDYESSVIARAAVGALRSAMIHEWRERTGRGENPDPAQLIHQAFSVLRAMD